MGLYIECPKPTGKARQLVGMAPARVVDAPTVFDPPAGETLVCVVDNVDLGFEAAAICCDEFEFVRFTYPDDDRPKEWLLMPTEDVARLSPLYARHLAQEET